MDPAEFRMKNFIKPEQFPYKSALGWEYDSGNYGGALQLAMDMIGYAELRQGAGRETRARRADGHRHLELHRDRRRRSVEALRHPRAQDVRQLRDPRASDRQGHRALRYQVAGPGARDDLRPDPRRRARDPCRQTSRSKKATPTPRRTGWAPMPAAARRSRARRRRSPRARSGTRRARSPRTCSRRARKIWSGSRASSPSRARPSASKTIQEIAFAAYTNHPQGMEAGLEAVSYYDPPNLTYPFGSYICVVDIDKGTGEVKIRRFVAVDDCGNIINPMIVEGQIHGGLTMGLAPALFEEISYDESGNIQRRQLHGLPAADRGGDAEVGDGPDRHAVAASPARRQGRRRVGDGRRARRRSSTRWWTRSGISACATSTSRSRRPRCGSCSAAHGVTRDERGIMADAAESTSRRISSVGASRSSWPRWSDASGRPRPSPAPRRSSSGRPRRRAGSAARAPSRFSSARRWARCATADRALVGLVRRGRAISPAAPRAFSSTP